MGFDKDITLYGFNCFTELSSLAMLANLDDMTNEQIIGYTNNKLKRANVKDDTGLFTTGIPENGEQERIQPLIAELAQDLYIIQIADKYQDGDVKQQTAIEKYDKSTTPTTTNALAIVKQEIQNQLTNYNPQRRTCTLFGCRLFGGTKNKKRKQRQRKGQKRTHRYKRLN